MVWTASGSGFQLRGVTASRCRACPGCSIVIAASWASSVWVAAGVRVAPLLIRADNCSS